MHTNLFAFTSSIGKRMDVGCDGKQMRARKPRFKYNAGAARC